MARENEKIPTSRVRRTATVAGLAASEAVKQFGTRAANVTRGEEASEDAMARRQLETAKQIVAVLGTMKGAAMKLGQVLSTVDFDLVPEDERENFKQRLASLRDDAPKVPFKDMKKLLDNWNSELPGLAAAIAHPDQAQDATHGQVAEGVKSCRSVRELAQHHGVEVPITEAVEAVCFGGMKPAQMLELLMSRSMKSEVRS